MPLPSPFTLICPGNDLESLRILDLADRLRCGRAPFDNSRWDYWRDITIVVGANPGGQTLDNCLLRHWPKNGPLGEAFHSRELAHYAQAADHGALLHFPAQADEGRCRQDSLVVAKLPGHYLPARLRRIFEARDQQLLMLEQPGYLDNDATPPQWAAEDDHPRNHHAPLRQFAQLIGYELTSADQMIALHSRDYLPGLIEHGVDYGTIKLLRDVALFIQGAVALPDRAALEPFIDSDILTLLIATPSDSSIRYDDVVRQWWNKTDGWCSNAAVLRPFDDITFALAPVSQRPVLLDVLHRGDDQAEEKFGDPKRRNQLLALGNTLIFYYEDKPEGQCPPHARVEPERIVALSFSGKAKYCELLRSLCRDVNYAALFHLQTGGGEHGCFFSLERRSVAASPECYTAVLTALVDRLLSEVMVFSRPLRHYSGSFFLPIELEDKAKGKNDALSSLEQALNNAEEWQPVRHQRYSPEQVGKIFAQGGAEPSLADPEAYATRLHAQEYFYFEPQVREFLYDFGENQSNKEMIKSWRYQPPTNLSVYHQDLLGKLSVYPPGSAVNRGQEAGDKASDKERATPLAEGFIAGVKLHLFFYRILLLEIEVQPLVTLEQNNNGFANALLPNWHYTTEGQRASRYSPANNPTATPEKPAFGPRHRLTLDDDGPGWWEGLVFGDAGSLTFYQRMQVGRWLDFSRTFRLLYTAYVPHASEGRLPLIGFDEITAAQSAGEGINRIRVHGETRYNIKDDRGADTKAGCVTKENAAKELLSPLIAWWLEKLEKILPVNSNALLDRHESRLFSQLVYCPAGRPPPSLTDSPVDRLFSLALYLDGPDSTFAKMDDYAYDPDFLRAIMDQHLHRRWRKNGVLSGFTDYSNVFMGYGGFFSEVIAKEHTPHHYRRMLVVALLYRGLLRYFSRGLKKIAVDLRDTRTSNRRLAELRRDFIEFTSHYWFEQLSEQMQGKELFSLQKHNLGLGEQYDFIKQQIDWNDSYLTERYNAKMQKLANKAAIVGLLLALIAIGINILDIVPEWKDWLIAHYPKPCVPVSNTPIPQKAIAPQPLNNDNTGLGNGPSVQLPPNNRL